MPDGLIFLRIQTWADQQAAAIVVALPVPRRQLVRVVAINRAGSALCGAQTVDLVGRHLATLIDPSDWPRLAAVRAGVDDDVPSTGRTLLRHRLGHAEDIWYHLQSVSSISVDAPLWVITLAREPWTAADLGATCTHAFELPPPAATAIKCRLLADTTVIDFTPGFAALVGRRPTALIGRRLNNLLPFVDGYRLAAELAIATPESPGQRIELIATEGDAVVRRFRLVCDAQFDGADHPRFHDVVLTGDAEDADRLFWEDGRGWQLHVQPRSRNMLVAFIDRQKSCRSVARDTARAALQFLGLASADLTGPHLRDIVGTESYSLFGPLFERALSGHRCHRTLSSIFVDTKLIAHA